MPRSHGIRGASGYRGGGASPPVSLSGPHPLSPSRGLTPCPPLRIRGEGGRKGSPEFPLSTSVERGTGGEANESERACHPERRRREGPAFGERRTPAGPSRPFPLMRDATASRSFARAHSRASVLTPCP